MTKSEFQTVFEGSSCEVRFQQMSLEKRRVGVVEGEEEVEVG